MKNGTTIPTTGELVVTTCWCGIQFAMPSALMRWHKDSEKNTTYCPLGHAGVIRESTSQKLEAAQARQRHLEDQLQAAEADAETARVQLLRARHRFANGVCPCCNRSFPNVANHIKSQHPHYDPADLEGLSKAECSCGRTFKSFQGLRIHQSCMRPENWADPKLSRYSRHLTVIKQ